MGLEMIKAFRKEKKMTLEELSEKSGVPISTIRKISAGITTDPNLSTVQAIAAALDCTLDDFSDTSQFGNIFTSSERQLIKKYRVISEKNPVGKKIIDFIVDEEYARSTNPNEIGETAAIYNLRPLRLSEQSSSAGTGTYLGPEAFTTIMVERNELTDRASFAVPVSGNSMEPIYFDKDILLVEKTEELRIGEIGIFTLDGEGFVKKLGEKELISLNPDYAPIPMNESISLNGKVIGILDPEWIK